MSKLNPTICLNMIVKNESKIITRMLQSVIGIIDCYCICDTGSTDDTIIVIQEFFNTSQKKITGKIIVEPFKNFQHNRNFALQHCFGMSDYILLMDADMILQINKFHKMDLWKANNFSILQGVSDYYYSNARFIQNNNLNTYVGVTHEYINLPIPVSLHAFSQEELFILDIGDGGCKQDKLERDIRLLLEGIEQEPSNASRYYFYLGNTYFGLHNWKKAIISYKKRIEFGGWEQELWYSYYKIGDAYKRLGNMSQAIVSWLEAYNCFPHRIENIYEIACYYRSIDQYNTAKLFIEIGKNILIKLKSKNINKNNFLFLQNDIYTHKLDFEILFLSPFIKLKNVVKEIVCVLNNSNTESTIRNTFAQMKHIKYILNPIFKKNFTTTITLLINNEEITMYSSSGSILYNDGYLMNMRFVNYVIDENGNYLHCKNNVITCNKYYELTSDFVIKKEKLFSVLYEEKRFLGIEDIRIFYNNNNNNNNNNNINNNIDFIGTTMHSDKKIGVVVGKYDITKENMEYTELKTNFNNRDCEKNWVYINYKKEKCIIYSWWPLKICKENTHYIELVEEKQIQSKMFRFVRGSTCPVEWNNEYWVILHMVAHERPRHYYHIFAVFDNCMNLVRYSGPFQFEGKPIEYCIGLIVEQNRVLVNYSTWDKTNTLAIYDMRYIENLLEFRI